MRRETYRDRKRERERVCVCCLESQLKYEGWNFNSGNYLFTTDTK